MRTSISILRAALVGGLLLLSAGCDSQTTVELHEPGQYKNNRAENPHRPSRQKERQMRGFKSPGHAQQFLSVHGSINNLFRRDRHLMSARSYSELRRQAFGAWSVVTETVPVIYTKGRVSVFDGILCLGI